MEGVDTQLCEISSHRRCSLLHPSCNQSVGGGREAVSGAKARTLGSLEFTPARGPRTSMDVIFLKNILDWW